MQFSGSAAPLSVYAVDFDLLAKTDQPALRNLKSVLIRIARQSHSSQASHQNASWETSSSTTDGWSILVQGMFRFVRSADTTHRPQRNSRAETADDETHVIAFHSERCAYVTLSSHGGLSALPSALSAAISASALSMRFSRNESVASRALSSAFRRSSGIVE